MTNEINAQTTVRDLVGHYPQTRGVFEKYGVDYCSHGVQSLADAAQQQHVSLSTLEGDLAEAISVRPGSENGEETDWTGTRLNNW